MMSNEAKLSAVIEALKAKGGFSTFTEKSKTLTGVEPKLNCALAVLKETAGIAEFTNEAGKWDLRFEEKAAPVVIKKNNGTMQTFVEGDPFNGERSTHYAYEAVNETADPFAATDKLLCESMKLSPEDTKRVMVGLGHRDDSVPDGLTEGQREEYRFARSIGISEADSLRLVNLTGGYSNDNKRVSGRILESRR
jgi:hypothetical protein